MKEQGRLPRRSFLNLMLKGGGGAVAAYYTYAAGAAHLSTGIPAEKRRFWEDLETKTLWMSEDEVSEFHQEVEMRYKVDIVDPNEMSHATFSSQYTYYEDVPTESVPTLPWEAPAITVLARSLQTLPAYLYQPRESGLRVKFILIPEFPTISIYSSETIAGYTYSPSVDEVYLGRNKNWFTFNRFNDVLLALAHELAHRVTYVNGLDLGQLLEILGKNNMSDLSDEFMFEQNLSLKEFQKEWNMVKYPQLKNGLFRIEEFVAIGAEIYLYGRKKFIAIYKPFLGQERSEKFYVWLKENIFAEWEI